MPAQRTARLLRSVARRMRLVAIVQNFFLWLIVFGAAFGVFLLASRASGWAVEFANWQTLLAVPLLAFIAALLRRPETIADAARRVDHQIRSKDLFLTCTQLDRTAGSYQELVVAQAESRAARIEPTSVVPVALGRYCGYALALAVGLMLGVLFMPQWDPFGSIAKVADADALAQELEKERAATKTRITQIKQQQTEQDDLTPADQSIEELKLSLRQMQPADKQPNLEKLNRHQADLARWRKQGSEKLKNLLSQSQSLQDFGGDRMQQLDDWTENLKNGDSQLVKQEINDLMDLARRIADADDPAQRAELMREMRDRLKDLERFASERAGSPEMAAAVRRAMRQMEAAQRDGMDEKSLQDLAESLELSQLEMEQIAQAAKEMKALEDAMKTLRMAKQLNSQEALDGESCQSCRTLADYQELYSQMMGEMNGTGELGGEGFGEGGSAPEDETAQTSFQDETSKTAIEAGKTLLSIKTRGMGEDTEVQKNYREQFEKVKQTASEAIVQEQIPPGYHDSIRGYFNSIAPPPRDAVAP